MSFEFGQDVVFTELMLYAPMDILEQIAEAQRESILADTQEEDAEIFEESVPVQNIHKLSRKQRRAARRVQNHAHKQSDRLHGKRHGDKYLESLSRKKYLEADNYDHLTFRVEKGKLRPIHDVKRARETARFHDALDVSEIERLTASVLAEVKQYHGMVGWTDNVFYLAGAICRREQFPYPDYAYVHEFRGKVELVLEYFDSYDDEEYSTYERINLC